MLLQATYRMGVFSLRQQGAISDPARDPKQRSEL